MTQEFGSDHARLARLGGTGALLSGAIFLLTLLYTYGYLISLGLTVEMLDDHEQLLPWVARHNGSYLGLWWIYLASQLCLLPVPVALHHRFQHVGSALSLVGAVAGVAAIVVGIVSIAINAATAPVLGPAYVAAEASRRPRAMSKSLSVGSRLPASPIHGHPGRPFALKTIRPGAVWMSTVGRVRHEFGL